jgi:S-adenosylmethionine/arginine decarboxylase-like enzyme
MTEPYGKELIIDLRDCNTETFTRESIGKFFDELCELIDMQAEDRHFWDDEGLPPEECQTNPKTCGVSAVQFILTSTIVVHTLTKLRTAYINIFSCKEFDVVKARHFTTNWFKAADWEDTTVVRK